MTRVRFSGFFGLIRGAGEARVDFVLATPEASGGPRHHATLLVESQQGLIGEPDFIVGDANSDRIYAGWHLSGRTVQVSDSPSTPQVIDHGDRDWEKFQPDVEKSWATLQVLPDFSEIGGSRRLSPEAGWPIHGRVHVSGGHVTVVKPFAAHCPLVFNFEDPATGRRVWPVDRPIGLQTEVTFGGAVRVQIASPDGRTADVELPHGSAAVIANAAAGTGADRPHGDVVYQFYEGATPKRRIRAGASTPASGQVSLRHFPFNPDECGNFRILVDFA